MSQGRVTIYQVSEALTPPRKSCEKCLGVAKWNFVRKYEGLFLCQSCLIAEIKKVDNE